MKRLTDNTMLALVAGALLLGAGCGDKAPPEAGARSSGRVAIPDQGGTETKAPPVIGDEHARPTERVDAPSQPVAEPGAVREGGAQSLINELVSLYRGWSGEEKSLIAEFPERLEAALGKAGELASLVRKVYEKAGKTPIMSRGGQLTEEAREVIELLGKVREHGLAPEPYALEELQDLVKRFGDTAGTGDAVPPLADSDKPLWDFVVSQRPRDGEEPDAARLAGLAQEAGFGDADLARLSELRKRVNALLSARKRVNEVLAELDVGLVTRVHRWVFDMRFAKKAHPFLADKSEVAGLKRAAPDLEKLVGGLDWQAPAAASTLMRDAVPKFPDYEPTRQALLRYRGYAERYPTHLELPKEVEKLGPRKSGELVSKIEERLIQEEYLTGTPTGTWNEDLTDAISEYQETHQMKPTGKIDKLTRASMNRTYAERAKQLELSLMRYRESDLHQGASRFGEAPVRARVNIPAMEARFYVGTEIGRRHRVVVGNNDTETDGETGKRGKLNQTRLFSAEMQTVVLNPVWNVPKRIKEQELDLLLMDEPDYYEKHNFKVELNPDGSERVVQQPGPGNALGLVKFLFPNQFSIYMHDTPKKKLFERPVRAFSHGCMRTENPLDLARWILVEIDKEMTNEQFDEILESREERHFAINPRIPISTDYVTTTIDEAGRINFLSDVYGFDKDYFEGTVPRVADKDFPLTVLF